MRNTNPADQKEKGGSGEDFAKNNLLQIPSINLPKGGGALKSIDEKFQVNSANGTAAFGIPLPQAKSRNEFVPNLSLNYNSGSGNSPFGLGWNISLAAIRRRTDKFLPQYKDNMDSDIFQLSGEDDLVLKLIQDGAGNWKRDQLQIGQYQIKRYRPRKEGAFTLIEQISSPGGIYWKTTTRDNVSTFYGLTAASRVADPRDPTRIFEWWPNIAYDDKGNSYQFFYVLEDLVNVPNILHEGNRLNGNQQPANIYLKRVVYGSKEPYRPALPGAIADPYLPFLPDASGYHFSLLLDYGDHDLVTPTPEPSLPWGCRLDPFSNYKPGFDCRCYRLCRRFLLFHDFAELDGEPVLVRSLEVTFLHYDFQPVSDPYKLAFAEVELIQSMTVTGWSGSRNAGYESTSYPSVSFSYQLPMWDSTLQNIPLEKLPNVPEGLSNRYRFTDLWNEGIAGILSEQADGWYYNSNCGNGVFTPASPVSPRPSFSGLDRGSLQLQSLTGDGRKFIVSNQRPNLGFFPLTDGEGWLPYQAYDRFPAIDIDDPNIKFIDLNGDGMAEIVLSEDEVFTWYPALGMSGYDSPELAAKPFDEEKGPAIVFADPVESIFLADMTGDGLTDIVRIRNGEISYWPNMGYGVFGAKVNMSYAPVFDDLSRFNPRYLHLADINGTGATDILYLGQDRFHAWLNLSGNAWGQPFEMIAFPNTAFPNQITVTDLLGNGTACIVWSSPLPNNADAPLGYIDLMGGKKPYLMNTYNNGMGKQTELSFRSSTWFYLQDKFAGTPWITKLCFPVHCVIGTMVIDAVSGSTYGCSYTYHHGYYDHAEKEFRGFARVEQIDTDVFDANAAADQAPMLTKTWYHTGAWFGVDRVLNQLEHEYFENPSFAEYTLPRPVLPPGLTTDEAREAVRACKGMVLRQEVYALDATDHPTLAPYPFSAAEHNNNIILLQPQGDNKYASFLVTESEQINYQFERNPADPRIAHTLNTAFDKYGNILESYAVTYPRQPVDPAHPGGLTLPGGQPLPVAVLQEQQKTLIVYTKNGYTGELNVDGGVYWLPVVCETIVYQAQGISPSADYFSIADLTAPAGIVLIRLKHQRSLFLADDLSTPLPLFIMDTLGMLYQQYHLAFDASVTALSGKATPALLGDGRYVELDVPGEWWVPSGTVQYLRGGTALPFLLPYQYVDAFGFVTSLDYDSYFLLMKSVTDALGNVTAIAEVDYRVLAARSVLDPNNNATDLRYDRLGLLVAMTLRGKGEGDILDASFTADLAPAVVASFFSDPIANGPAVLQGATTRYLYQFPVVAGNPVGAGSVTRGLPANQSLDPRVDKASAPYQYGFEYTDGLGRAAMKKIRADAPGGSPVQHRWIGSGKIIYNNKGKPVMQYEPWFSGTPAYEEAPANGVTPVLHYDPLGRAVLTDFPDGSYAKTEFDAWVEIAYDQNDTVLDSGWYAQHAASADPLQVDAATKAAAHDNTPMAGHLDGLGRKWYSVAYNRSGGVNSFFATQTVLDLGSNPLRLIDPMGNTVIQYDYDLLNRVVHQISMDAGEQWVLHNCMDKPLYQWDVNGANAYTYRYEYDGLHRLVKSHVWIGATEYLFAYTIYGEGIAGDVANNLRTRPYRHFDDAGLLTNYVYDFKGNPVRGSRALAVSYKAAQALLPVNVWSGDPAADQGLLEQDGGQPREYTMQMEYDALNRMVMQVVNGTDTIVQGYGEAGMLNTVDVYYGGSSVATSFVTRIDHNEKGQRLSIQYGNNTVTKYQYDAETFRLERLISTRNHGADTLQDLFYYYDPAGNVTYSPDKAQPPVFYNNQKVLSDGNYTYDALYRLIRASGREQIAQNTVNESAAGSNYRDFPFGSLSPPPAPTDSLAMRNYTQVYGYDPAGNMTQLQHVAGSGSYTRSFVYNKNQLLSTTVSNGSAVQYGYDGHGNLLGLPQLPAMAWNFKDQLESVVQQAVGGGDGRSTYYNYDVSGMRIRKGTEASGSVRVSERVYLGMLEIYREFDSGGTVVLERDTLHIKDGERRVAVIDTKRVDSLGGDSTAIGTPYPRYQYGNHLDSVAFELDGSAHTISYEEYHPFGTSSFQAADAGLDVPAKRYRYTGKERDEESGLYYHGARYYAPWLCRWISCDPIGIMDGLNVYAYVKGNPVIGKDPSGKSIEFKKSTISPVTKKEEMMIVEMIRHDISLSFGLETTYDEKTHKLTVADTNNDGKIDEEDIEIAKARFLAAAREDKESDPKDVKRAAELVDIFLRSLLPDDDKNRPNTSVYLSGLRNGPAGLASLGKNKNPSLTLFVHPHFTNYVLLRPEVEVYENAENDLAYDDLTKDSPTAIAAGPLFTILHEMGHNALGREDNVGPKDPIGDNVKVVATIQKALGLPDQQQYGFGKLGREYSTGAIRADVNFESLDEFKIWWDTGENWPEARAAAAVGGPMWPPLMDILHRSLAHYGF
jgi:RHS repeat-associated protein